MAGIYIHIPFCKKACHYCNFHFSTSLKLKKNLLIALLKEIELQKNYLRQKSVETIYFGGGTPSLLNIDEFKRIFDKLDQTFNLSNVKEITLEANPDDLNINYLTQLKQLPINRLSIGIQSFNDEDLQWMNRSHTANEALACIKNSQSIGFTNLNIDLIYGIPKNVSNSFKQNLDTFLSLNIPHLSAYCLTVEAKTVLSHQINKGESAAVDEHQASIEMLYLMQYLKQQGFEQYEISNFAKNEQYAQHNTNYWKQISYLGLGPSAHSFDGLNRQWNVSNNAMYLKYINNNDVFFKKETLSNQNRFNEYIMTALRTQWGIDLNYLEEAFDGNYIQHLFECLNTGKYQKEVHYTIKKDHIILLKKGKLMADGIAAEFFLAI